MKVENYIYQVNLFKIEQHFVELKKQKYHHYVSKDFFGIKIRTTKPVEFLDGTKVILSVRYSGHDFSGRDDGLPNRVTGVKIDLIELSDARIKKYDIDSDKLQEVMLDINTVPSNVAIIDEGYQKCVTIYDNDVDIMAVLRLVNKQNSFSAN